MGDLGISTISLPRFAAHLSVNPSVHHMNYPSDSPSLSDCMHASTRHLSAFPSSTTTDCPSSTSQSLPVMNGEQSHQAKKSFCVDPHKSGEIHEKHMPSWLM